MNTNNSDYFTFNTGNSLLLLGRTGSGKSVLCETLFKRFIKAKTPEELRFVVLGMTCHDAEILRDEHPEYIEELVEGTHIEKAFETLEKYAELAKTGRPDERSQIVILIEECDMARYNQGRFESAIKVLTSHAEQANMKLIYSTHVEPQPFKISIEHSLENKYGFKDVKNSGLKQLHSFIEETVGKQLTITQVEGLYLRKRGLKKNMTNRNINGEDREEVHLGKDRKPFRLFGYYSGDYFVITKIDCNHSTHKS